MIYVLFDGPLTNDKISIIARSNTKEEAVKLANGYFTNDFWVNFNEIYIYEVTPLLKVTRVIDTHQTQIGDD